MDTTIVNPPLVKQEWDLKIKPQNSFFSLNVKDVWNYRDLLWLLVRRDFVSLYKQTILGPLWFFIQPLLTTLMFTLVFGMMGGFSTNDLPKPLFYLAGITAWNYFADCLTKTATVFRDNSHIFGKVYFPRLIMPLSIIVSNLVRFGVQFILFLVAILYYYLKGTAIHFTWALSLFPLIVLLMAALGLGAGMIVSAMTTKYRDLAFLLTFGVQLLMYATTIIYPLSSVSDKYKSWIELNPMTPLIETFRYGFLGKGSFSWTALGYTSIISFTLLITGIFIFNKVEKNFVDTV
jgi:lipopolysaccharide transport system permease protein